jgi:putative DNA primase/helicase
VISDLRIPDDLPELDQWVLWRYEIRDQKRTKILYFGQTLSGQIANPKDWAPLEDVLAAWRQQAGAHNGIGFVFSKSDPFAGIDLDDSLEDGEPRAWAHGMIERFFLAVNSLSG